VNHVHARQRCGELFATALIALVHRDGDADRGVLGGFGERFGFVEQPGLLGVEPITGSLL
jgi:hypothetical protein